MKSQPQAVQGFKNGNVARARTHTHTHTHKTSYEKQTLVILSSKTPLVTSD